MTAAMAPDAPTTGTVLEGWRATWAAMATKPPASSADPDGLHVAEGPDAVGGQLPAVARALHPAERQLRERGNHPVDEHRPRLEVAHEPVLLGPIGGPGVGAKAEAGGVGQVDGLVEAAHPVEGGDGAEH